MNYPQIIQSIIDRKFSPVYLLHGEEDFFIDEIMNKLEAYSMPESERDFNLSIVYGKDADGKRIAGEARRYPMMGAEKVFILVREAQALSKIDELLEQYVANPNPTSVLALAFKKKKIDKRTKLFQAADKKGVVFSSDKLRDHLLTEWAVSHAQGMGLRLDSKAAYMITELIGNDLSQMDSQLKKLQMVLPKGEAISDKMVAEHIGLSKEYNPFELVKALMRKDRFKVQQIIQYQKYHSKDLPLPMVTAILYGQFEKLLLLHYGPDKKPDYFEKQFGIKAYTLKELQSYKTVFDARACSRILLLCKEYDGKSKGFGTGKTDSTELFREFVWKIQLLAR